MTTLTILTPWVGDGLTIQTAYRPLVCDVFATQSFQDVTGTPTTNLWPDPNLYVARITVTDAVAAAIAADPVWGPRILMEE